jgi:hypothetical protein
VLIQHDATSRVELVLSTKRDWFEAVADVFGMPLDDIDHVGRERLWQWLSESHDAWLAEAAEGPPAE